MIVKVTNQKELDAALKNPDTEVWLIGSGVFTVSDSASVTATHQVPVQIFSAITYLTEVQ